jgi:hypothetical protein
MSEMAEMSNVQNLYGQANPSGETLQEKHYSDLARELKQFTGWVVGVLCDPVFSGLETPFDLGFEDFLQAWGKLTNVKVVPLDVNQVHSYEILFKGKIDILVFPYGNVFPMDAEGFYSAQTMNYFLRQGGAVLMTGGIPYMKQAGPRGKIIPTQSPEEMTAVYDKWVSKSGIKYYECAVLPGQQRVNTNLLPSLPEILEAAPSHYGVLVANSSHDPLPKPPHGNVFPERYPARQVIPLVVGTDLYGQPVSTAAVMAQDFETGSREIYFTHEDNPHPLSPGSGYFDGLMQDLFALLTNRVVAAEVEAEYACYRQGEIVAIRSEIVSHELEEQPCILRLVITGAGQTVFSQDLSVTLNPGQNIHEWAWKPEAFGTDEYLIQILVIRGERAVSQAENGFAVWNGQVIQQSPRIGLRKQYFTLDGRGAFITGTNYYESTRGEVMWFRPNVANLIRDLHQMHTCGVNMIRPHYHHLKWFKDYLLYHHRRLFPFYKELETLNDPQPDERVWRIWDLFIYLTQKYGITYNGDLFTLVPSEMGDPRGWFGTVEAVYDLEKRVPQKEFLRALELRYRDIPGITWDLFNEPYNPTDQEVAEWAADLAKVFTELESPRLISVGGPLHIGATVDYDCPHGRIKEDFYNRLDTPILLQELHLDRPEPLSAELLQAEDLRYMTVLSLRNGMAGLCPWSWTRQMRLWQDTYEHHYTFPMEKWDDRLGLHTHEDGTIKVAGQVFKDLAILLKGIDLLEYDLENRLILTSRGSLAATIQGQDGQVGQRLIHSQGEQCFAGMALEKIEWQGQDLVCGPAASYVYFYAPQDHFATARQLLVKSEGPGLLKVARGEVQVVDLVDGFSPDFQSLAAVVHRQEQGETLIEVGPEMTRYWLRLIFK